MERKLVTIRTISAIDPIEGADAIDVATVDGWKVVVKKGQFSAGDKVVYFEIDSILPDDREEFAFLMARGCKDQPTDVPGVTLRGHRLRTIKLRGQVSQGLVLPIPQFMVLDDHRVEVWDESSMFETYSLDDDFSVVFGVMKYEKPIPANLSGKVRGNYPAWLPKTDQERVQNCFNKLPDGESWCIEEKVEGSSITIYTNGETVGVTSRNLDLELDQEGNTFVDVAKASGLLAYLSEQTIPVAFRGELVGPNIQGNIYGLKEHRIYIYDIWEVDSYLSPQDRSSYLKRLFESWSINSDVVKLVPVIEYSATIDKTQTVDAIIEGADGMSKISYTTLREGVVYKSNLVPVISFKAISNQYLLKEKD